MIHNLINFKVRFLFLAIVGCIVFLTFSCNNNDASKESTSAQDQTGADVNKDTLVSTSKSIVFFGNSLTAGYGLDPEEAFPSLIQKKLDSMNLNYKVLNAGVSGETSSTGKNRISWLLKQEIDVFVLELGANDGLRGLPVEETKKNLTDIIKAVKGKYPEAMIILAGMQIPPNMGKEYAESFKKIYDEIAKKENTYLIPFLLENVGGEVNLNQPDGIHPTAEGQRIVAENVWKVLKEVVVN